MERGKVIRLDRDARLDGAQLERWIAGAARGEIGALEAIYRAAGSAVYAFALSILKHPQDAEDVYQDTFIRLWEGAGSYRPQGKPMAWLLRITRNLALSRLREGSRLLPDDPTGQGDIAAPQDLPPEDRLLLQALLERLPDQSRQIVTLHAISGLKHREIASLLDLPLPTVLSKYYRALTTLRNAWKESEGS